MVPSILTCSAFVAGVVLLAGFFAKVEIHIEGANAWASSLPTWRIEGHWLLRWFFGGRAMTGYHAWMLSFMLLIFHLPLLATWSWSWRLEERLLAGYMIFWIAEDALWFVLNPAWGLSRLTRAHAPWHKHWLGGLPVDYWIFAALASGLLYLSFFHHPG